MKNLACWDIMNCHDESCVVRGMVDKECWEIVAELEDYRAEFDVCADCLVYVLKTGSITLSDQEVAVMAASKSCVLST
nr:hypothetical protein [Desulfobulbaceae bacterium]